MGGCGLTSRTAPPKPLAEVELMALRAAGGTSEAPAAGGEVDMASGGTAVTRGV